MFIWEIANKINNKKYHSFGTVSESNSKIVEKEVKIDTPP
jgi:hypothetical protein